MLVETRVLPTTPPIRVRLHEPVLNAATAYATSAWISGLSFAMACALLAQEWAGVTGFPVDEPQRTGRAGRRDRGA